MNVLFVALLAAWGVGLVHGHDLPLRLHGLGTTCDGLPSFEALGPRLDGARRVAVVTDLPPPDDNRRLFCAQHDLAPVPLELWRLGAFDFKRQDLAATAVIVHLDDPAVRRATVDALAVAAAEQGLAVQVERADGRVAVLRVAERGGL